MATINLRSLISKLNPTCRQTLEGAAGLCLSRTNYNVEIAHWLLKLIDAPGSDVAALFKHFGVNVSRLTADLTKSIDGMKRGNQNAPGLSPNVVTLAREAWLVASLDAGAYLTRSCHLLAALLSDDSLAYLVQQKGFEELAKIPADTLKREMLDVCSGTTEAQGDVPPSREAGESSGQPAVRPGGPSKTPALDQFTIDLTAKAKQGKIDPVLGRDPEIRLIIDILTRRRQNNPILTGEAGVGKTAVVEGFAQRVADGDVPAALKDVSVRTLDLGLLQAGAGIKGEFENRLKNVIEEVKSSPKPIIVFIDEAHTLIGAGGQAGQGDAANLLKPALARGELRTIAATTWAEYKKYFEKDAALARRFQVVKVEEPDEKIACRMIRGLVATLEKHHQVRILEEAVTEAVRLSNRYISGRQLPDKAVSLLDTACARVAIGHSSTPPALEDCRRRIDATAVSIDILTRESTVGINHKDQLAELTQYKADAEKEFGALEKRWGEEKGLVDQIREARQKLEGPLAKPAAADGKAAKPVEMPAAEREKLFGELEKLTKELRKLQGEAPLMQVCVDGQAIAEVVAGWTGIPVGRMVSDEIRTILNLKGKLEERIIGQGHALEAIAQSIRTSRANLTDPRKPIGVFLMVGTSGVGKTETAVALAELLYGGDQNMTVINMSEFKEEHKVSLLMGSPPGYVGYGEGGVLTEAVRRKPYSVVLLDEMEKAHPGVQDIFFQVFDKGMMKDGEGRDIDFKNTIIIMTSNAATDLVLKLCADPETRPDPVALAEALHPELTKTFKPAFLGRVTTVPYFPLADDVMRKIIELKLGGVTRRVKANYKASFTYSPEVVGHIAERCKEVHTGGRNIDHIINRTLLPELSAEFLSRMAEGQAIGSVKVSVGKEGQFEYGIS